MDAKNKICICYPGMLPAYNCPIHGSNAIDKIFDRDNLLSYENLYKGMVQEYKRVQDQLTQSQEQIRELEERLAVAEELFRYVLSSAFYAKDRTRRGKSIEAFLAHQTRDYVAVRWEDLKFIVDALTTPKTLTIYEEIVRLQAALNPQPATDDMVEKNNAH